MSNFKPENKNSINFLSQRKFHEEFEKQMHLELMKDINKKRFGINVINEPNVNLFHEKVIFI